jgi:hypothetical protein
MRHRLARLARGSQRCVLRFAARATEELDHGVIEGRDIVGFAAGDQIGLRTLFGHVSKSKRAP